MFRRWLDYVRLTQDLRSREAEVEKLRVDYRNLEQRLEVERARNLHREDWLVGLIAREKGQPAPPVRPPMPVSVGDKPVSESSTADKAAHDFFMECARDRGVSSERAEADFATFRLTGRLPGSETFVVEGDDLFS